MDNWKQLYTVQHAIGTLKDVLADINLERVSHDGDDFHECLRELNELYDYILRRRDEQVS